MIIIIIIIIITIIKPLTDEGEKETCEPGEKKPNNKLQKPDVYDWLK